MAMEKLLKTVIEELHQGRAMDIEPAMKTVPVQRLKYVRDGNIKYQVPRVPITSPEHCLGIFRDHFKSAPGEMVSVLSVNAQNQYLAVTPVAWGTLKYVHVTLRQIFTPLLAKDNAAAFILAHNHPSGDPTPSPDDLDRLEEARAEGIRLECPLLDFIIIGQGTDAYYSHRESHGDF